MLCTTVEHNDTHIHYEQFLKFGVGLGLVCTACSELRKVLFLALSVTFLFVYEISWEPLNGFAPNSQERRVWSLARMSLNVKVKVKGQGHEGQKTAFRPFWRPVYSLCLVKTPLASSCVFV